MSWFARTTIKTTRRVLQGCSRTRLAVSGRSGFPGDGPSGLWICSPQTMSSSGNSRTISRQSNRTPWRTRVRRPAKPAKEKPDEAGVLGQIDNSDNDQRVLDAIDSVDEATCPHWWPSRFGGPRSQLWADCLNAAGRIRRIAKGARDVGARVRWFDYTEFRARELPQGGIPGFLQPVNSVEVSPKVAHRRLTAFDFLRLTVANAESLVFHAPSGTEPQVLFSADSDLSFNIPVQAGALVTAPHHGSESNNAAYDVMGKAASPVTWVRSDGRFQKRPGPTFRKQPQTYCTRCRGKTAAGQAVRFASVEGSWAAVAGVTACSCGSL